MIKLVGGVADFQSAAEANPNATPACFVFLMDERPGPSQTDVLIQRVEATIGVVFVVKNLRPKGGSIDASGLNELRASVKKHLFGWQPSEAFDPFERGASRLLSFRDGHAWWQDLYLTAYYDRSEL